MSIVEALSRVRLNDCPHRYVYQGEKEGEADFRSWTGKDQNACETLKGEMKYSKPPKLLSLSEIVDKVQEAVESRKENLGIETPEQVEKKMGEIFPLGEGDFLETVTAYGVMKPSVAGVAEEKRGKIWAILNSDLEALDRVPATLKEMSTRQRARVDKIGGIWGWFIKLIYFWWYDKSVQIEKIRTDVEDLTGKMRTAEDARLSAVFQEIRDYAVPQIEEFHGIESNHCQRLLKGQNFIYWIYDPKGGGIETEDLTKRGEPVREVLCYTKFGDRIYSDPFISLEKQAELEKIRQKILVYGEIYRDLKNTHQKGRPWVKALT